MPDGFERVFGPGRSSSGSDRERDRVGEADVLLLAGGVMLARYVPVGAPECDPGVSAAESLVEFYEKPGVAPYAAGNYGEFVCSFISQALAKRTGADSPLCDNVMVALSADDIEQLERWLRRLEA